MTFVAIALMGAGVICIVSAIENTSIMDTLKKILSGDVSVELVK